MGIKRLKTKSHPRHLTKKFAIIKTNASEIESIVRRVLATLTGDATSLGDTRLPSVASKSTLSVTDSVVSLQSLKDRIRGIEVLEIGKSAVMTPSARDYCRELRVEVIRGAAARLQSGSESRTATRLQRLLVVGTPEWMPALSKQICNKQAQVGETAKDDAAVLRLIAEGIRAGHQAGVAVVRSPHAVCWQAARDDRLRPAVVPNWSELNDVLQQVPVNVLILSSQSWNVPSVCNSVRRLFQHLQNQS